MDLMWFCVMTPLAVVSSYLVLLSTRGLMGMTIVDNPLILVSLLMTSSITLAVYYGWAITVIMYHASCWLRWRRSHCVVHLLTHPPATVP